LTHRSLAASFAVVTGQEDETKTRPAVDWGALATAVDTLVILMGSRALPDIARTLIAHGRSPETPVALIHGATTPRQETLTGTLADFVDPDTAPALPAPVVTVIGDVVGVREQLGLATVGASRAVTA
jgi:siroheme synthase